MKPLFTILFSSLLWSSAVLAQTNTADLRLKQIREAYQEKLRVDVRTLASMKSHKASEPEPAATSEAALGSNEKAVSSVTTAEAEIHAAINPKDTNNIVVSPIQLSSTMAMPIYYTRDFGKTWKKSSFKPVPYETGALVIGGGDPLFSFDANGKLYMSWIDLYVNSTFDSLFSATYWAYSADGGQNWIRPKSGYVGSSKTHFDLVNGPGADFALDDKEWVAVDRTSSPNRGNMYVAWTHVAQNEYGVYVRTKRNDEDTLRTPVLVSQNIYAEVQYTSIGVDKQGGVHVAFLGADVPGHMGLYHAYSADGGVTFQPEELVSYIDVPGASDDAIQDTVYGLRRPGNYPCPHLGIDTAASGNMYLVWNALGTGSNEGHGADIWMSRWNGESRKWSTPSVLNDDTHQDPTDHFYPSIAVNGNGVVTVTWYDRREDPDNISARLYATQSFDFGHTWTKNAAVAAQPTDFSTVGSQNGGFGIGEYYQVLTTNGYAIPVWTDGRKGNGDLDIYAAFLPISKDGLSVGSRLERVRALVDNVSVYPSPARSRLHASFSVEHATTGSVIVVNQIGQTLLTALSGNLAQGDRKFDIDIKTLAAGSYYLLINTAEGSEEVPFSVVR